MKSRLVLVICLFTSLVLSQDRTMEAGKTAPQSSIPAWKGTIRKTVERTGTFVPAEATEIKLDLKVYSSRAGLRMVEVLPHGSFVNQGDVIARLDTEGIDKQITADKMSLERAEMGLRHAEASARESAQKAEESLTRSQTGASRAAKKLRGFREHEKGFNEENERLTIQWRQYGLENQKDELDQLEKMYSEDELVDATEEIVLKRSRRRYARSVATNNLNERRRVYTKEWYESYREEDYETDAQKKAKSLDRLRQSQKRGREKTDAGFKKQRYDLEQQRTRFADLQRDKEQFIVRAPQSGILLHGKADAAPWPMRLEEGSSVRNLSVFATVANNKKLKVKTTIPEGDILALKSGTAAEVVATADESVKLMGRVQVEYLPGKKGAFEATVHLGKGDMSLRPGFTCKVHVIMEEERDAILIPKTALITKGDGTIVRCAKVEGGPFEERKVVIGLDDGKNVAIRDGLAAGEYVVAPPAKASPMKKKMRR